ncbi:unnamed protein product [Chrysoparadoxa australica]
MKVINLADKLGQFKDHWNPRVIAELNGQQVKLAKIKGPFVWHAHADEDELFLVLDGQMKMEFRDRTETVNKGEMILIPKGVEHRPVAEDEVQIMLFEPIGTVNTGGTESELTRDQLKRL